MTTRCVTMRWLPIGTGLGVAVGVADGNLALWLAFGIALGFALDRNQENKRRCR